jgi:hypothetical protein
MRIKDLTKSPVATRREARTAITGRTNVPKNVHDVLTENKTDPIDLTDIEHVSRRDDDLPIQHVSSVGADIVSSEDVIDLTTKKSNDYVFEKRPKLPSKIDFNVLCQESHSALNWLIKGHTRASTRHFKYITDMDVLFFTLMMSSCAEIAHTQKLRNVYSDHIRRDPMRSEVKSKELLASFDEEMRILSETRSTWYQKTDMKMRNVLNSIQHKIKNMF